MRFEFLLEKMYILLGLCLVIGLINNFPNIFKFIFSKKKIKIKKIRQQKKNR